ncbi:MAG: hypothetical protein HY236_17580 [Acidobacteria bacterium]|nr:hypothetical protein [Acidobacteriota bacterium]
MPFCSQCGNQLTAWDFFCGKCGGRQPIPGTPGVYRPSPADGITPRTASMLCYVPFVGWIAALLVLAAERFREMRDVRFHAFQGLYLFVAWLLLDWAVVPWFHVLPPHIFPLGKVLQLVILGLWILMLIKTSREEKFSLPLIGELAERSL